VVHTLLMLAAAAPQWIVLPVYAENPPPSDPTLLRTTRVIAQTIFEHTGARIRVLSREARDEHCADDGHRCPGAIARLLDVERVIALELAADRGSVRARVYEQRPARLAMEIVVPCEWDGGPECDAAPLAQKLATGRAGYDPAAVEAAWAKVAPRIAKCFTKVPPAKDARLTFALQPSGRPIEVRVEPKKLQSGASYACAARVAESLRVPPFEGASQRLERALAD
jgi:hypothetical protein